MRILPIPLEVEPVADLEAAAPNASVPSAPSVAPERIELLEKNVRLVQEEFRRVHFAIQELQAQGPVYERVLAALHKMEERLTALEPPKENVDPGVPPEVESAVISPEASVLEAFSTIAVEPVKPPEPVESVAAVEPAPKATAAVSETIQKELLAKMWKYLNTKE